MASFEAAEAQVLLLFSVCIVLSLFIHGGSSSVITCQTKCGVKGKGPVVRFPFRLINQPERCGYPGYDLSCNNMTETVIRLPKSGEFIVRRIDYLRQTLIIDEPDPNSCLPRRFLDKSFSLAGSPFEEQEYHPTQFTFLNCSPGGQMPTNVSGLRTVRCLSGANFTVVAVPAYYKHNTSTVLSSCSEIDTVWFNPAEGVTLKWNVPNCTSCEDRGGFCGFKNGASRDRLTVGCANLRRASPGLPRSAKYGIIIGAGIPAVLSIIGIGCYLCGRCRACCYQQYRNSEDTEFGYPTRPQLQPAVVPTGLDIPTIESYPKTILGDSGRLPGEPNDNTCPICLCEYHPKETLRAIPKCNHYFHATCIDEWLKINATCPLCRNTRENSSVLTPCSSTSSSSSSSSLMAVP